MSVSHGIPVIPFRTAVTGRNSVTGLTEHEDGPLTAGIDPAVPGQVMNPNGEGPYPVQITMTQKVTVDELGLPDRKVNYEVEAKFGRYEDERGIIHHLRLQVSGMSLCHRASDAVFEKALSLIMTHKVNPATAFSIMEEFYGVRIRPGIGHFFLHRAAQRADDLTPPGHWK